MVYLFILTIKICLKIIRFPPITNNCTGSRQFRVNKYLALLVPLSIRHVRDLKQIGPIVMLVCLDIVSYPTTFERENACATYCFKLNFR